MASNLCQCEKVIDSRDTLANTLTKSTTQQRDFNTPEISNKTIDSQRMNGTSSTVTLPKEVSKLNGGIDKIFLEDRLSMKEFTDNINNVRQTKQADKKKQRRDQSLKLHEGQLVMLTPPKTAIKTNNSSKVPAVVFKITRQNNDNNGCSVYCVTDYGIVGHNKKAYPIDKYDVIPLPQEATVSLMLREISNKILQHQSFDESNYEYVTLQMAHNKMIDMDQRCYCKGKCATKHCPCKASKRSCSNLCL